MPYLKIVLFATMGLLLVSCTKTVVYKQSGQEIRPLKTDATVIRLHEDFLYAERDGFELKRRVIENIVRAMNQNQRYRFEFIPSGKEVPRNDSNRKNIFLIGDIWFHQGETSGNQVFKVTRSRSGTGFTQSWDELERRQWRQDALQTVVSLYFVEIGTTTRILRSTITVSNDKQQRIQVGGRAYTDNQHSQFYQDKKLQAGHLVIQAETDIRDRDKALEELASRAVAIHFSSL